MLISLSSPNGTYDNIFLANYAYINLNYALTRLAGHRIGIGIRRRPVLHARLGNPGYAGESQRYRS